MLPIRAFPPLETRLLNIYQFIIIPYTHYLFGLVLDSGNKAEVEWDRHSPCLHGTLVWWGRWNESESWNDLCYEDSDTG